MVTVLPDVVLSVVAVVVLAVVPVVVVADDVLIGVLEVVEPVGFYKFFTCICSAR